MLERRKVAGPCEWLPPRELQARELLGEAALNLCLMGNLGHVGVGGIVHVCCRGRCRRLRVGGEGTEAARHLIVLLFVHLLSQDDLARDLERLARPLLVDFGCSSSRV